MPAVLFEEAAQDDLDKLWETDEDAAALIFVLIEEFQDCPEMASRLIEQGYRDIRDPAFEVLRFEELWRSGLNMYRLKYWDQQGALGTYRIVYAHNPVTDCIHILGIIHRGIDYDTTHPTVVRIRSDYAKLGIPTY